MDRARSELLDALIVGDEERVRCILFDLHLGSISWCDLGDRVIAPAFHQIGELWECGRAEVYVERRACGCLMRALDELRSGAFSEAKGAGPAPLAIGAGAPGDGGALASMLVELVLRGERWRAESLGPNLPLSTLAAAVRDLRPRLVWISATHLERPESFLAEYDPFYEQMEQSGTPVAVGGRALAEDVRRRMKFAVYCESLARLVPFAAALRSPPGGANVA